MAKPALIYTLANDNALRSGAAVSDAVALLAGVQESMRLLVQRLGLRKDARGRPPQWVQRQSALRIEDIRFGSFAVTLAPEAPSNGQAFLEDLQGQAFDMLRQWKGAGDALLPPEVSARLQEIPRQLSPGTRLWQGDAENFRRMEIVAPPARSAPLPGAEKASLYGWIREVNWDKGTAQLHPYGSDYVALRFDGSFATDMLRLATRYVHVEGDGRINAREVWTEVSVKSIREAGLPGEAFSLESFLNDPHPKIFSLDKVVTASEPFDADEFNRAILDGRNAGSQGAGG